MRPPRGLADRTRLPSGPARRRAGAGLTLLEIIVALGVLAIGSTAAFGLLVAAAAAGRRAEHEVHSALIAETILNDLKGYPITAAAFDALPPAEPRADGRGGLGADRDRDRDREAELEPGGGLPGAGGSRYLERDRVLDAYPEYTFDIILTPVEGPVPDDPWQYLVEVEVRWSQRGRRQSAVFATVLLKGIGHLDNPTPTPTR